MIEDVWVQAVTTGAVALAGVVLGARFTRRDGKAEDDRMRRLDERAKRDTEIAVHLGKIDDSLAGISTRTAVLEASLRFLVNRRRETDHDDD